MRDNNIFTACRPRYIVSQDKNLFICFQYYKSVCIEDGNILATTPDNEEDALGEYETDEEAREVFEKLITWLEQDNSTVFRMPQGKNE